MNSTIDELVSEISQKGILSGLNQVNINQKFDFVVSEIEKVISEKGVTVEYLSADDMRPYFNKIMEGVSISEGNIIFANLRTGKYFIVDEKIYLPLRVGKDNLGTLKIKLSDFVEDNQSKNLKQINSVKNQLEQILYGPFNKSKVDYLLEIAYTDKLTSLGNKLAHDTDFAKFVSSAKKDGTDLSYIFLDLNKFKGINDHYGHLHGDDILSQMGELILDQTYRLNDEAYRIGGDEFSILLPYTNKEGALKFAERLYDKVKSHKFKDYRINQIFNQHTPPYPYNPTHITISVGISSFPETTSNPDLLKRDADVALYMAKRVQEEKLLGLKSGGGQDKYGSLPRPVVLFSQ